MGTTLPTHFKRGKTLLINIEKLHCWMDNGPRDSPLWAQLELSSSKFSLQSLITARLPLEIHGISENPIVTNSLKIWVQFCKHFGLILTIGVRPHLLRLAQQRLV